MNIVDFLEKNITEYPDMIIETNSFGGMDICINEDTYNGDDTITDLTDLFTYYPRTTMLDIANHPIINSNNMGYNKNSLVIGLRNCNITDISTYSEYDNLYQLFLNDNPKLTDISCLIDIKGLEVVCLNDTGINDISFIERSKYQIVDLFLQNCKRLIDVSILEESINLSRLDVRGCNRLDIINIERFKNQYPCDIMSNTKNLPAYYNEYHINQKKTISKHMEFMRGKKIDDFLN